MVTIRAIAAGGEGVGRLPDGCAVFVHRTAPGDEVEVAVTRRRQRWARANLVELLHPGEGRRQPPCPFYDHCGGCTLQHLTEETQRRAKADILAQVLARVGGVEVATPTVLSAPQAWRYRNRMTFVLRRLGNGVAAGLHALGEPDRIVEVDDRCLLPEPAVGRAWARVRAALAARPQLLPPVQSDVQLTVRATFAGEVLLHVTGGGGGWDARELARATGPWLGAWQRTPDGRLRRLLGVTGEDDLAGERVCVAGDSFVQVNREAAALLYQEVERQTGDVLGTRVVEAYADVAIVSRRLARAGGRLVALEGNPHAAAEARRAGGFEVVTGAVERHLAAALPAEVVILNPPRAGLGADVVATLLSTPPRRVVYVSCDPATLARDVRRLAGSFTLADLRCVDLFPQTAHVETVASLVAVPRHEARAT